MNVALNSFLMMIRKSKTWMNYVLLIYVLSQILPTRQQTFNITFSVIAYMTLCNNLVNNHTIRATLSGSKCHSSLLGHYMKYICFLWRLHLTLIMYNMLGLLFIVHAKSFWLCGVWLQCCTCMTNVFLSKVSGNINRYKRYKT